PFEALDPSAPFVRHNKRAIKGTLKYHDSRPGGLPGVSTPGWDPRVAQSMSSGGIQGDVRLEGTGVLRVDAVFVTPLDAAAGVAHIAVIVTNLSSRPREATLVVATRPDDHVSTPSRAALAFTAPPGASRLDLEGVVPGARPWWPRSHHDLGGPALHHLHVALLDGEALSDERSTRFGFRTARVTEEPKHLEVNGRPVFVQAVNYIPRQHFAGLTTAPYHEDLALCADAHVNSLGVHGHLQCRPCYDAADEAGFLVFQDFPLQWHYESGSATNPGFIDLACRQIAEMAYTFHDHPSIVYWACHNEPTALFIPGMPRNEEYDFDNQVLDEALETRLRQVEHHRHVHRASGIGDDYHLYDGSLNGGTVYGARDRKSWFISEYGFWTLAPTASRYGDVDWPPDDRQFSEWLSRLSFGPWTMMYAGLPERYASLDAFRRATEAYGEFLTKYQTEWIRLNRGNPYAAYRFHFFVDWWGWAGGGLVDVDRKPKATYHALRLASRPVLVATSLPHTVFAPGSEVTFEVAAVNETRAPIDVDCAWSLHHPPSCIAIGCDLEAADRLNAFSRAEPGTVVAVPAEAPGPVVHGVAPLRERGRLRGRVPPESVAVLGTVTARLPETPLASLRLELEWGGERNHYQVLAAEPGWFPGPGAFLVSPGSVERLR
ncbi:MAG: hypothetical protein FJ104_12975, partial [Deltaproteobacteria bacterium]|nr:hypothetical protein [Deltaproteobacteria bacterium]